MPAQPSRQPRGPQQPQGSRHGRAGSAPAPRRVTRRTVAATEPANARPVVVARGRNRLTGRATALVVVLAMLAVAYTWPVKEYLRQRSEIARLRADTAATQARVDVLSALKARWDDPAYVQAQARERLHFVLPGETAYVVLQPDHPAAPPTLPKQTAQVLPAWYDQLWSSVRGADAQSQH